MSSRSDDDAQENTCVVCFKGVDIYSIGQCDHPVCYECSTRMRVLCRQNECPICRQDMPKVIFTKHIQSYNSLKNVNGIIDKKFKIVFETEDDKRAYDLLLAHECPKCGKVFTTFTYLRDHVRRVHQLNYCDLCVDNLKIYSRERRCYNRHELTQHRKEGDPDDRSHRGHPLCEFCDTRYMDNDELYRHLRRDHLFCHFCDADGLHQYYSSYDFLRDHFRSEHFLCEEGDCFNEKFTAVFRSEIDLKAHKATIHGKGLGKAGLKQARTLELEFTLAPRPRPMHGRTPRFRDEQQPQQQYVDRDPGGEAAGGYPSPPVEEEVKRVVTPQLRREEDFPALGSEPSATSLSLRLTSQKQPNVSIHTSIQVNHPRFTTKVTSQNSYNYHFPALDNAKSGGDVAVTSVSWSACSGGPRKATDYRPSNSSLPPTEDFPSLSEPSNRTAVGTQSEPTDDEPIGRQASLYQPHHLPIQQHRQLPLQQPSSKSKKKKTKPVAKSGIENSAPVANSSTGLSSNSGESKSKKNKKDTKEPKLVPKVETNKVDNNIENINNNNNNVDFENIIKAMSIMSEKPRSAVPRERIPREPVVRRGEDFPTLGGSGIGGGGEQLPVSEMAPKWEVKKPPKPPPGLGKPPPGLPPPGFSGLNGGFPPLVGEQEAPSENGYISPNNFIKRNTALVKIINSSLVGETIEEFKQISSAFRKGSLTAPEYYAHCKEMLGLINFKELFPELISLLPNIEKQQALWKVYKADKSFSSGSSKKKGSRMEECATCGQIVQGTDLREHLAHHRGIEASLKANTHNSNPWAKLHL